MARGHLVSGPLHSSIVTYLVSAAMDVWTAFVEAGTRPNSDVSQVLALRRSRFWIPNCLCGLRYAHEVLEHAYGAMLAYFPAEGDNFALWWRSGNVGQNT